MTITTAEATTQAIQLFNQKAKYDDIAEHLAKLGYVSDRTKKPVGPQTVRNMIHSALKSEKKQDKSDDVKRAGATADKSDVEVVKDATPVVATAPASSPAPLTNHRLDAIRQIMALEIADAYKVKIIKTLLEE